MSNPVSVIITTHNRADLLPRAVRSVLGQTFGDFELIIVDDHSEDQTPDIVRTFSDERINYIRHEENHGLSAARNTGVRHASGAYIAFLDDDDEWLPTKLEKQVEYLHGLPDSVGMIYCWMAYYNGDRVVAKRHPKLKGSIFGQVLANQPLGNGSTWLVRESTIKVVGEFDEGLSRGIDGDFVRRLCLEYEVDYVPEVLVKYHIAHEHQRITRFDEQGIRNAIKGQKAKLTKFKDELEDYPEQTASILSIIAYHYSEVGEWRNSARFYCKAFSTHPFCVGLYVNIARALRTQIAKWAI